MDHKNAQHQSIVLIGFMGVGKTTTGRVLADKLNYEVIDMDEEIEKKFNLPTTEIFSQLGQEIFRETEKALSLKWAKADQKVLSLGGGAFLQQEIRDACLKHGIVIYLEMNWEYWKMRLKHLTPTRPLLQGKDLEDIERLYHERIKFYQDHHLKVNIDGLTVEEVVEKIIGMLANYQSSK